MEHKENKMNLNDLKRGVYQAVFTESESKILNNLDFQNVSKVIDYLASRGVIQQWQDIKTAPKDGTTKALYGCYKDGKWYVQITARGKGVGGLHVNVPTGFRSYTEATHWMPLPQLPKEIK